jgi:hypothetical protein
MGKTKNNSSATPASRRDRQITKRQRPERVSFSRLRGNYSPAVEQQAPEAEAPAASEPSTDHSPLTDAEILERFDQRLFDHDPKRRGVIIDQGTTLHRPSENNREYRGIIRIAPKPGGGVEYQGVTQWGPSGRVGSQEKIVYRGPTPQFAAVDVNKMISKKVNKGGYQPINDQQPALVNADRALQAARRLVGKK